MNCLWISALIGLMIVAWMIENAQREKFVNAASVWAQRQGLQVLALEHRYGGWGGVFWRYNAKWHYHFRATLRTKSGSVRDAWIICQKSFFGGPTDRIHLEYID